MVKNRYLTEEVLQDLLEKMAFIGGARQVGKTTFAVKIIGEKLGKFASYNWDSRSDRRAVMKSDWPGDADDRRPKALVRRGSQACGKIDFVGAFRLQREAEDPLCLPGDPGTWRASFYERRPRDFRRPFSEWTGLRGGPVDSQSFPLTW